MILGFGAHGMGWHWESGADGTVRPFTVTMVMVFRGAMGEQGENVGIIISVP